MNDFDMVAVLDQKIRKIRDENRVAAKILRGKECCDETEAQGC